MLVDVSRGIISKYIQDNMWYPCLLFIFHVEQNGKTRPIIRN